LCFQKTPPADEMIFVFNKKDRRENIF
jgi:hypothetical protein